MIDPLPPAPSRANDTPQDFSDKADAFAAALPTFQQQSNAAVVGINFTTSIPLWTATTSYVRGNAVYSPATYFTYRLTAVSLAGNASNQDPSVDTANWKQVTGSGNVSNGGSASLTTLSATGNLNFTGTAQRITGNFSNATLANRAMFQTSTPNAPTVLHAIPNGTVASGQNASQFVVEDSTSIATGNGSAGGLQNVQSTEIRISANARGTGAFLPITFYTSQTERLRIDTTGNVLVTSAAGLGYGTGSGGTATQATSKSTAVTLNKPTGQITMNNAALAANTTVAFVFNNSLLATTDTIILSIQGGVVSGAAYNVWVTNINSGACGIAVRNISAGTLSEQLVINFAVIRGASA